MRARWRRPLQSGQTAGIQTALLGPPDRRLHHTFQLLAAPGAERKTPILYRVKVKSSRLTPHTLPLHNTTRFHRRVHPKVLPPAHIGASSLPMQQASTNDQACTSTYLPHTESTSPPTASPEHSHNSSPSRGMSKRCSASWRRRVLALNRGRGSRDRYCKTEA